MLLSVPILRLAQLTHCLLIGCVALRDPSIVSGVLALLLLLPLPGILRGRTYTCAWASMMIAFYAAAYLADGYAEASTRLSAFLVATVGVTEFAALVLYVRFTARERQATESSVSAANSDDVSP